ncbi:MAG TPA: sigma 54-interacting transcriptional regulator [Verrucomicrobiae bacterium]|nr:sigma 54-interacting transcriptional regulator [Verrucomicrobiae bacterium]
MDKPLHEDVLRSIVEGTAGETGEGFFTTLVQNLSRALNTRGAWVTEYLPDRRRLRARAFLWDGNWLTDYEYEITGTPCETVIIKKERLHVPEGLMTLYACDEDLKKLGVVSYLGAPILDTDGEVLGAVGVMNRQPIPPEPRLMGLFQIFAERAGAELRRVRAEADLREREAKLRGLVDGAMDAIIEIDAQLRVTRFNPSAAKTLGGEPTGDFSRYLTPESRERLSPLTPGWIAGGLTMRRADGGEFPAEATLSRFEIHGQPFFTLILRNVNDRLEIQYLREELRTIEGYGDIIGHSDAMRHVLQDVQQVAETDSTVLILGETGVGKELFARAIHAGSKRCDEPLIKVNCAAIPATLIESEFFGHEKGAFTGATSQREGRFALADGGTIFLDEIGDLPLELQSKLLRVLQEGEFEPVGSSRTRKVNVRVIAATNRNLLQDVRDGKFREDLYYRLNVFPIEVPPLRARGDDVLSLAGAFVKKFSTQMGRAIVPLDENCARRLRAYDWPGNVRELQNVIERAVITARDGRLNLDRALPESATVAPPTSTTAVLTTTELRQLERQNIVRALESCEWRVAGKDGAAQLLGLSPSTLNSRIKSLGIKRVTKSRE